MLGTPPAFILSQDQTLLFNLWFRSTLVNLSRFYCLLGLFLPSLKTSGTVPLNNSFWNFQGCITVYLSRYFAGFFSLPALSGFRAFLSRNGDYLITCCFSSQALFSTFFTQLILFSTVPRWSFSIAPVFSICQQFFTDSFYFFSTCSLHTRFCDFKSISCVFFPYNELAETDCSHSVIRFAS